MGKFLADLERSLQTLQSLLRVSGLDLDPVEMGKLRSEVSALESRLRGIRRSMSRKVAEEILYQEIQKVASDHPETRMHLVPLIRSWVR